MKKGGRLLVEIISYLYVLLEALTVNYGFIGVIRGVINYLSNCFFLKL